MVSKQIQTSLFLVLNLCISSNAFSSHSVLPSIRSDRAIHVTPAVANDVAADQDLEVNVAQLKKCLEREYVSFFNPMEREYYNEIVSFDDPMTTLNGIDSYQNNVDMLSSRTMLGSILFEDANIVLHSVTGGEVDSENNKISNVITRWTLRMTAKILPWKPTARFTGISVYEVQPGGPKGVQIMKQLDYWDSTDIQEGGEYGRMDKGVAVKDFLDQLKSENFNAPSVGPELPYELLRRGNGYDVRRFPAYLAVKIPYERRDEAYNTLGSVTRGMEPMAPSIVDVDKKSSEKFMAWPLTYTVGDDSSITIESMMTDLPKSVQEQLKEYSGCEVIKVPRKVVAIRTFSDACVEPVVRREDQRLKDALIHDGISISTTDLDGKLKFAQYDAVFTMGKRRSEVWIELEDGCHPW